MGDASVDVLVDADSVARANAVADGVTELRLGRRAAPRRPPRVGSSAVKTHPVVVVAAMGTALFSALLPLPRVVPVVSVVVFLRAGCRDWELPREMSSCWGEEEERVLVGD